MKRKRNPVTAGLMHLIRGIAADHLATQAYRRLKRRKKRR